MRRLVRPGLGPNSAPFYQRWTALIRRKRKPGTRVAEAHRLWKQSRGTNAVRDAVEQLHAMNDNLDTCMYCEHDRARAFKDGIFKSVVDHWEPIKHAPLRAFDWDNHFLACSRCNTLLKGADFPLDSMKRPLLLNPAKEDPSDHLEFIPSNGEFTPKMASPKGAETIEFFQLGDFNKSRADVWAGHLRRLHEYDDAIARGDGVEANKIRQKILSGDHRSVLHYLVDIALGPSGAVLTDDPEVPRIVSHHNIRSWL